jgi:hypothetical protein
MSDGLENADVAVETHGLLLSLAGLIDDELLGWCRELVAVGESEYALELVTASVQADRVRLPEQLHTDLLDTALRHRVLGRADTLPPVDHSPRMRHKFSTDPTEHGFPEQPFGPPPEEALGLVPSRLLRDCQLWLTWRLTPAGGAPGPVPHPVVLVETADALGAEALAYQVAEVLSRAGVFASVEVFSSSLQLGDYHREALAAARSLSQGEKRDDGGYREHFGVSGTGPLEVAPVEPPKPSPRPTPRARVEANGVAPRGGEEGSAPPRPKPSPSPEATNSPSPLRPVDRVMTARDSARGRLPGTRQPGSSDDVAAGLHFEQGVVNGESVDHEVPSTPERPETDRQDSSWEHRPSLPKREEPPAARGTQGQSQSSGPSTQKPPSPGPSPERTGGVRPSPGPSAQGASQQTPGSGTQSMGSAAQGPGSAVQGPGTQPPTAPVKRPAPPHQTGAGAPPKRPSPHPQADVPADDPDGLSDVEQRLLRQLQDELAAREDRPNGEPSGADQPPSRIFRSANGGARKRPPRGPERGN